MLVVNNITTNNPCHEKARFVFSAAVGGSSDRPPRHEEIGMNPRDFNEAVRIINNENFDEKRLATAERIIAANPMSTRQIANICKLFNFESNRLEFAKYAYRRCVDPNNYFLIDEVFTFDASKKELYNFIRNR